MAKKVCFVLGAGGARGIAHVGFLQAMDENKIKPDCIIGCSMGSVVGSCYAAGLTPEKMKKEAENLRFKDLVDLHLSIFSKNGILRSVKMRNKVASLLEGKDFKDLKIPFMCVAVDLLTGEVVPLKEGPLAPAVCASSAIPTVFRSVEIDGRHLIDGGALERVPTRFAKDFGADVVVAVDVLGKLRVVEEPKSVLQLLLRTVDIVDCENTKKYLKKYKPNLLIEPELGDMSQYKVEKLAFAYEQGYKAGLENVEKIKKLIKG